MRENSSKESNGGRRVGFIAETVVGLMETEVNGLEAKINVQTLHLHES